MLAKFRVVKIANYGTSVCGDVAAYTGSVLVVVCMLHCSEVAYFRTAQRTNTNKDPLI